MAKTGKAYILAIRRAWRFNLVMTGVLIAMGCTAVVTSFLHRAGEFSLLWAVPLFVAILVSIFKIEKHWKVSDTDVSRFLNERFPELEESTQLFLKPQKSLSLLEKIQSVSIEKRISTLPAIKHRALFYRIAAFLGCLAIASAIWIFPLNTVEKSASPLVPESNRLSPMAKQTVLPAKIRSAKISIIPPAYTRKVRRDQRTLL